MNSAPACLRTPLPADCAAVLSQLRTCSDAGLLRQLDSAFAAFIAELSAESGTPPTPALLVTVALLSQMESRGHACLALDALISSPQALLAWPPHAHEALAALWQGLPTSTAAWLQALAADPTVQRIGHDRDEGQPLLIDGSDDAPRLYLRRYWQYERTVEAAVRARCTPEPTADPARLLDWLDRLFPPASGSQTANPHAPDWQRIACAIALRSRLAIITGGPGTGKTYTAARLLALLLASSPDRERLRVALAAPTGKAAARLKQSIDSALGDLQNSLGSKLNLVAFTTRIGPARTLHALLGARMDSRALRQHAGNPLDVDVLIVDEASMVHLEMMAALLDALPPQARLVLLGDKDQLASVEAGAVLGDLCRDAEAGHYDAASAQYVQESCAETLPPGLMAPTQPAPALAQCTVMLRHSKRFDGAIGALASAVNSATDPALPAALLTRGEDLALYGNESGTPAEAVRLAIDGREGAAGWSDYLDLLQTSAANRNAGEHEAWASQVLAAFDRCRVLCAVREGDWGAEGMNRAIEAELAKRGLLATRGQWYAGRPVMVTRNDPALGVFNGDIGIALPTAEAGANLRVYFSDGGQLRSIAVARLAHVQTAFAMTVHKSQGSEFNHPILLLPAHAGALLSRELVYTAITRARNAFSLIAQKPGLLETAVRQPTRRASGLRFDR